MNTETAKLQTLLRDLVASYVDHPSEVRVDAVEYSRGANFSLSFARSDFGKVIGKEGLHFGALRALVETIGDTQNQTYFLEDVRDPEPSAGEMSTASSPKRSYNGDEAISLLARVLDYFVGEFRIESTVKRNQIVRVPYPMLANLTIYVRDDENYAELAAPKSGRTIVSLLGVLFRARANCERIGIQLDVVRV